SAERSRGGCAKPSDSSILSCWRGNFQNSSRFLHISCWNDPMSTAPLETRASTVPSEVADRLRSIVGERNCIVESSQLRTYASDGLTSFHAMPAIVVLPASTAAVVQIVRIAHQAGLPIVPRGARTGLPARTLPCRGCSSGVL